MQLARLVSLPTMTGWVAAAVAAAALSGLLVAGCGDVGQSSSTTPPTTAQAPGTTTASVAATSTLPPVTSEPPTTATTVTTVTTATTAEPTTTTASGPTTTEQLSSAETRLPDGTIRGMGYIDKVWVAGGVRHLRIDYAEMLSGKEAEQAAIADKVIKPGETLDNDYYIRNENSKKREFAIAGRVRIETQTRQGGMEQPATWEEFLSFWGPNPPGDAAHLKDMPWWIVRDGDEVIDISEQYLP